MPQPASPIAQLLSRHGVRPVVATPLERAARSLRRRCERQGREFAAFFDAGTGERLAVDPGGHERQVDLRPFLRAMEPDRSYLGFHTHPTSTPFSDADGLALVLNAGIRSIIVLGVDGIWYAMSKSTPDVFSLDRAAEMVSEFRGMLGERAVYYLQRVRSGQMGDHEGLTAAMHEAWSATAPHFGLTYERLEL